MRRLWIAVVATTVLLATPVPAHAARVPGVDVSQWQGVVDWTAVAATTTRFAILRADKGADLVDPTYAVNLAGASGAGLVVGAYHRATPSAVDGDAVAEAEHFLAVARNAPGDLLPALDIEETGGLAPADLVAWVRAWVRRVRAELGVRSLLYASPYFWRTNMGDVTWFAERGYPLWIAHWGVDTPDVPADGWAGRGWAVWQWTSTGRVAGIATAVDRDRVAGGDLGAVRIASLTITPRAGGRVTGDRLNCGASGHRCVRLANPGDELVLTAEPDADAVFLRWAGDCAGVVGPTCALTAAGDRTAWAVFGYPVSVAVTGTGAGNVVSDPEAIRCPEAACTAAVEAGAIVRLHAAPDSASGFVTWGGDCAGPAPECDLTVDGPRTVTARFDATTVLGEDGPGTGYAWARARDPAGIGATAWRERTAGARIGFAVRGPVATLYLRTGPAMGRASIASDGFPVRTVDGYAPVPGFNSVRLEGLGPGEHVLSITVAGTRRAESRGTWVAPDALRDGGVRYDDPRPVAAAWAPRDVPGATDGTVVVSSAVGARASIAFTGTGVTLRTRVGPHGGTASLSVDGILVRTLRLAAPEVAFVGRTITGLTDGAHTVRLEVLGDGAVVVDGWVVR